MIKFRKESGEYEVDYTLFNNTYEVDTPLYSSKQLDEVRAELHSQNGLSKLKIKVKTNSYITQGAAIPVVYYYIYQLLPQILLVTTQ